MAGLAIETRGGLLDVGDVVRVELPVDPAELALDDAPRRQALDIEVLEVERHVPASVRVELVDLPHVADLADELLDPPSTPGRSGGDIR